MHGSLNGKQLNLAGSACQSYFKTSLNGRVFRLMFFKLLFFFFLMQKSRASDYCKEFYYRVLFFALFVTLFPSYSLNEGDNLLFTSPRTIGFYLPCRLLISQTKLYFKKIFHCTLGTISGSLLGKL